MCGRGVQVMCLCTCVMGEACVHVWEGCVRMWEVMCLCTCVMIEVCMHVWEGCVHMWEGFASDVSVHMCDD